MSGKVAPNREGSRVRGAGVFCAMEVGSTRSYITEMLLGTQRMPMNCLNGTGENCNKGILRLFFDAGPPENLQAFGTTPSSLTRV